MGLLYRSPWMEQEDEKTSLLTPCSAMAASRPIVPPTLVL